MEYAPEGIQVEAIAAPSPFGQLKKILSYWEIRLPWRNIWFPTALVRRSFIEKISLYRAKYLAHWNRKPRLWPT